MVKKKGTSDAITVEEGEIPVIIEAADLPEESVQVEGNDPDYEKLLEIAQEIRKNSDIMGYILKGEEKATVDLDEPDNMIEYAMLSSQAFESSQSLASTFSMGQTESVLVEGKTLKALCLDLGQNKISIFMKRNVDPVNILREFTS